METELSQPVKTGMQFASEVLLPGGSNIISGDFVTGGIYTFLGLAARAMFGVPGLLLVSASSFSKATTGHSLLEGLKKTPAPQPPAATPKAE